MSVHTEEIPQVDENDRVKCHELGEGFYQVMARYGFMETPDVPDVLRALGRAEDNGKPVTVKLANTTFYLGRETLIATDGRQEETAGRETAARAAGWDDWRKKLFILMARNAQSATAYFGLPPNRVVELGAQIQF